MAALAMKASARNGNSSAAPTATMPTNTIMRAAYRADPVKLGA